MPAKRTLYQPIEDVNTSHEVFLSSPGTVLAATSGPEHCYSVPTQCENRFPIVRDAQNIAKIVRNIVLAIFPMFRAILALFPAPGTLGKRLEHCPGATSGTPSA
jgi:hypothetical protein